MAKKVKKDNRKEIMKLKIELKNLNERSIKYKKLKEKIDKLQKKN